MLPRFSFLMPALVLLSILALATPAPAEKAPWVAGTLALWNSMLDAAEAYVRERQPSDEETATHRELIKWVKGQAAIVKADAEQQLKTTEDMLEARGAPPGEGEAPEPAESRARRELYANEIAALRARLAQADLALRRVGSLQKSISSMTREFLLAQILEPRPVPVLPGVVARAAPEFLSLLATLARSPADWYRALTAPQKARLAFWHLPLALALAVLLGWLARHRLLRRLEPEPALETPTYARRLIAATARGVGRGLIPALVLLGLFFWFRRPEALISGLFAEVIEALLIALFVFVLAYALPRAILAPNLPAWRLTELTWESAQALSRRITLLAGVFAVDIFLVHSSRSLGASPDLESVYLALTTTVEALIMLSFTQDRLWQRREAVGEAPTEAEEDDGKIPRRGFWHRVRQAIGVISLLSLIPLLSGYVTAGRFVIENLLFSGVVIGPMILARGLLRELVGVLSRSDVLRRRLKVRVSTLQSLKFWMRAALDPLLVVVGLFLVAPLWQVPQDDLIRWTVALFQGFTIGSVTISLADIVLALVVFMAAMALTKLLQRALLEKVLPETKMDVSVQHSLAAGVGYVGILVALALSVAVAGVDLTNLALVAGALSVGIGFGLQNVVNNFVSGLILLVERPLKVGDWVVFGDKEGFVKRVNFRATEVETWQRASVIIPNAEILSSAFTNWTHKNRYGRVEITVGVKYGSDTARVSEILLDCARHHPRIMSQPEPFVLFQDFGASSLDFELRCFTGNVMDRRAIASDIRFEIDRRFRDAGIEIPFPQRVVHMPSEGDRVIVDRAADRHGGEAGEAG